MNVQTTTAIVRRLLSLVMACGLLAAIAPAAQAQLAANGRKYVRNNQKLQPTAKDKAAGATAVAAAVGCTDLLVILSGTSASVAKVSCEHGYNGPRVPDSSQITTGKPLVLFLQQSAVYGPDCTITVSGGGNTAVVSVQQNFCAAKAGQITASVTSGSATLNGTAVGSFADNIPGIAWFTIGF
jgi:hypothetical protein